MTMDKGTKQAMQSLGEGVRAGEGRSTAEDRRETGGRQERLYGKDLTVEVECMERGIMAREEEEERRGQPEEEVGGDDDVEGVEEENGGQDGDVEEELDRQYGSDSGDGGGKDDDVEMTEERRKVEDDVVTKETDDNRWREEQQAVEGGELQRQVGEREKEGKETKDPGLAAKRKADRPRRGRGKGPRSDM
ncbi:hypothetical protein PAMA_015746 [Pampus argenteus]